MQYFKWNLRGYSNFHDARHKILSVEDSPNKAKKLAAFINLVMLFCMDLH